MNMIVAYDITDPKRLAKVAKTMEDYGTRVQKSIFEVEADARIFFLMKKRLESIIDPKTDGIKYFPLCEKCAGTLEVIGQGHFLDPDHEFLIL
ncbi:MULTISPECIES: CRISPR-associated endonuclease Cas2 [Desulfatibacillum]|jgi:CRISPR-associated protein Cas2|uniref:CRISPR-associated endoribonuclease Cas2 n=1 Tax=Desulfatibacillum alkenivorans DSM 16219 TaxID=1121393 RepID=A0A1M6QTY1_9BACT|nr:MULTISPECIES: CRISPR-associated endonuclease Cas2 [Desulfatibacillum]SHK23684.1 CRISPR-associated protein, Cas2 family [Desulfatibacillum alkenivorans DSM 16219]